jgi:hypothetical protein
VLAGDYAWVIDVKDAGRLRGALVEGLGGTDYEISENGIVVFAARILFVVDE